MIKNTELLERGFIVLDFPLDSLICEFIENRRWSELDQYFLEISKTKGLLRNFLSVILDFEKLEHIIAIRSAPDDEEGIWHDDGSRICGFSLSLNRFPQTIKGGDLFFREKQSELMEIFSPRPYGKIIIFLSGLSGYEHKVGAVTEGERIVIAGWCS